jgi:hypothetical protein
MPQKQGTKMHHMPKKPKKNGAEELAINNKQLTTRQPSHKPQTISHNPQNGT